jgi:hypothetical protein
MSAESFVIIAILWPLHLVPFLVLGLPLWFLGRKRVRWNRWDFLVVVVPFAVWAALTLFFWDLDFPKSLANAVSEGTGVAVAIALAPVTRVIVGGRADQTRLAFALLLLLCAVACSLWGFTPLLDWS